jgi:hypothetical protein
VASFILALFSPPPASAQVTINPGGAANITAPTGGDTSCRINAASISCAILRFLGTDVVTSNTVRAHYEQLLPAIGVPNYAAAGVYADIALPGPPNSFVDAQIATTFDFSGFLFGAGAYKGTATVSLHVTDITSGGSVPVASHTLFEQERSGDQGLTDVTAGGETQTLRGSTSTFRVTLRRGRTYRLTFEAEVLGEALIVGKVMSEATATWIRSAVTVDEDEVDLLAIHDTGMQSALAAHDLAVRTQVAQHDADIKEELAEIRKKLDEQTALLEEIKRLLLTPQGLREGFPIIK